ncbi:MAG: PDDEXK nuclease domain-containing protein [Phycisphaerae bacterium]|nr:PDDEXK nuclease domain-containing protein [Phycisphaerae bacterium]
MNENEFPLAPKGDETNFYQQVANLLAAARQYAKRQLDNTIVTTYYEIGRMIFEREQQGQQRAKYGANLLKGLSGYLTGLYGKGFSVVNLQSIRKFYQVYAPSISQTLSSFPVVSDSPDSTLGTPVRKQQTLSAISAKSDSRNEMLGTPVRKGQTVSVQFKLSWSHYQILMRVENAAARRFYEIEAVSQQWTFRQLQRQIGSSLYERLALSRDKDKVMALANEGQTVVDIRDLFKSPYVLEFTGLDERTEYSETELEQALIDNLQKFLLELGKGFLFESRQKRFSFDEESFYVDLVFYNRLLQCYVLIDLKIAKVKHQDLGQMMMYVNYFDRHVWKEFEKPTIGILLCSRKNDSVVEMTLPKDSNIYAAEYGLYLPDKALLQQKLAEWVEEFEAKHGHNGDSEP